VICGHLKEGPKSFNFIFHLFGMNYGPHISLQFMYVKRMSDRITANYLKKVLKTRPTAVIFNTGAWDYLEIGKARFEKSVTSSEDCDTQTDTEIANLRANTAAVEDYTQVGRIGRDLGVPLIYRTNHHNTRFGANCADAQLLPIFQKAHWEIWDNARISEEVWKTQCWDGFHFDRTNTHTVEQHKEHIAASEVRHRESPGMLEMQLAHSLLFHLFRDTIQEFKDKGIPIPV
jgi:hypothetical protein